MPKNIYKGNEPEALYRHGTSARAPRLGPEAAMLLGMQSKAGNAAVSRALTVQRLWDRSGKTLRPFSVSGGTGPGGNLKWNKGSGGVGGKKTYNTGFWCTTEDAQDQLHVHMGNAGGLTQSGGAHHWKRGNTYGAAVSEAELERVFGSKNVTQWTKPSYTIP